MKNVSVVILNFNGEKLLSHFLPSVVAHSGDAKIVLADNGSTDASVQLVKEKYPGIEIIQLEKNYGFCGGYNIALKQVEADYYVLLNSDVEVTQHWLEPMIGLLQSDATIAAVQPKILSYNQKEYFEYAGAGGGFIDSWGYPFCRGRVFNYTEKDTGQYNDTREVFWASGACLVIRSQVFNALKGFDETFFAHMEEIDLCWRIQRSEYRVLYCGVSWVYHVGAGTLSRSNPKKTYYNFRNGLALLVKHLPSTTLALKFPIRLVLDYLAALKFIVEGNFTDAVAILKAHVDFFWDFKAVRKNRAQLRSTFPFTSKNVYAGLVPFEYYVLGRKKININNPR